MNLSLVISMLKIYVYDGGDNPILIIDTNINKDEFGKNTRRLAGIY